VTPPNPALQAFLRQIPLFEFTLDEDTDELLRLLVADELRAGDILFREGDSGTALWILGEGTEVSVTSLTGQNRAVVVNYATKGAVVGDMALIDDGPRSGTGLVTVSGPAHRIEARDFYALRSLFSPTAFRILRKMCVDLSARLRATNDRIAPAGHHGIETIAPPSGPIQRAEELDVFPAFANMPAVVKFALSQRLHRIAVNDMTPIFAEGEKNNGVYFIAEGEVIVGRNGKTFANLPAGTMFGQVACIDGGTRSASCLTKGPAVLFHMSAKDFDTLFESGHRFTMQVVDLVARQLVQHIREANALLPAPGRVSSIGTAKALQTSLKMEAQSDDVSAISDELSFHDVFASDSLTFNEVAPLEIEIDVS
jgi:CRP/FNR family transcriptional regulator, cyclic AMP receptor protein